MASSVESSSDVVTVRIDVWSDYVCPFCYLEEPVLAQIRSIFPGVAVARRAFELRPEQVPTLDPKGDYLRDVWARSVYPLSHERGMTLRLPPMQPRSRVAHEAVAFARTHQKDEELHTAIFRAFFEYGEDIGQVDVLAGLASSVGLSETALRGALGGATHRAAVLADEQLAQHLGMKGVPAMTIRAASDPLEQAVIVEGAQPFEAVRRAVDRVAQSRA